MLKLFLKDVKAGAIFLWAVLPLDALAALQLSRSGGGFFWTNVTGAAFILVALSMLDWKYDTDPFVHSLPVTRALVVKARYMTAAGIGALSLLVGAAVGTARGLALAAQGAPWPRWIAGDMALAFLLAYALVAAIYLPCYFRWGFGKGNVAAALALAAGILVVGFLGPEAGGVAHGGVPPGQIPQGVADVVERFGLAGGVVAVLSAAAALWWASSKVAMRVYERREF
jgi:hypothetical protein